MADVEAHITGTVWKIECEVGDEIEEGDTVAILTISYVRSRSRVRDRSWKRSKCSLGRGSL